MTEEDEYDESPDPEADVERLETLDTEEAADDPPDDPPLPPPLPEPLPELTDDEPAVPELPE